MKLIGGTTGSVLQALCDEFGETREFTLEKGMVWFLPLDGNRVVQRMEWSLSTTLQAKVKSFLNTWLSKTLNIDNIRIMGRKTNSMVMSPDEGYEIAGEVEMMLAFDLTFGTVEKTVSVALDFDLKSGGSTLTLTLKFDGPSSGSRGATLNDMLSWLETLLPSTAALSDIVDWFPKVDAAGVKRVEMRCSQGSIDRVSVDMEFVPGWKDAEDGGKDVIFLVRF
jgi:hypothetical protein